MNKKGQIEFNIATIVVVIVGLILFAILMGFMVNSVLTPFGNAIGNVSEPAKQNITFIHGTFTNFWDYIIMIVFLVNVILLFVTAFLIDTHPIFFVLYMIFGVVTLIFAPQCLSALDKIYAQPALQDTALQLPLTTFLKDYMGVILLGIFFVTGIIMYGKYKLFGRNN